MRLYRKAKLKALILSMYTEDQYSVRAIKALHVSTSRKIVPQKEQGELLNIVSGLKGDIVEKMAVK